MSAYQPDLWHDEREEQRRRDQQPHACPICGKTEATKHLRTLSHGSDDAGSVFGFPPGHHPIYGAKCLAQHMVTTHVHMWARGLITGPGREDTWERARQLGLDPDAIAAEVAA